MFKKLAAGTCAIAILVSGSVSAQVNLTAETASPGGATHLSPAHLTEIAGTKGIANIQLADGQTLTNSIQNVAEGKTDIAATPYILPFLMAGALVPMDRWAKRRAPSLLAILGRSTLLHSAFSCCMPMTLKISVAGTT